MKLNEQSQWGSTRVSNLRGNNSSRSGPDQSHGVTILHLDAVTFIDLWDLPIRASTPLARSCWVNSGVSRS